MSVCHFCSACPCLRESPRRVASSQCRPHKGETMGQSCDLCVTSSITCTRPPSKWRACYKCTWRHDKCLIHGELVTQCALHSSRLKEKKERVVSQPVIEEVNKEAAVEELMGKEAMPEEVPIKAVTLEEVPVMHMPPCLEELVWASLQEIHSCASLRRGNLTHHNSEQYTSLVHHYLLH